MRVELYNAMKWSSEGTQFFRKLDIFIRAYTVNNIFMRKLEL